MSLLDGFGRPTTPSAEAQPIAARDFARTQVSSKNPPGLYGAHGVENALNEMAAGDTLLPLGDLGQPLQSYGALHTKPLQPGLLAGGRGAAAAGCAAGADAARVHSAPLAGSAARGAGALLLVFTLIPQARADDAQAMKAALDTRLAYVKTGLADVDDTSEAGLTGLGLVLRARTSYEPKEPIGVDLEHDDLSFFPLLYWPMDPREKNLSPSVQSQTVRLYAPGRHHPVRHPRPHAGGGARPRLARRADLAPPDPGPGPAALAAGARRSCADQGVLYRARLPRPLAGRTGVGRGAAAVKAGDTPARGGDGVSPVIIGGNDWAAAWAVDRSMRFLNEPVPGGESQREMAFRFGVNLVMYALTGNYKTDQVHAPALLERLGK